MKLRCLLVDDEAPALDVLQSHISNTKGLEVVACCNNAVEAMDVLHEKQVDLIFLDIKMPRLWVQIFYAAFPQPQKLFLLPHTGITHQKALISMP